MGTEALSKVNRRDIRRAFAPEASEEVIKFVDGVRQEIALDKASQHNFNVAQHQINQSMALRMTCAEGYVNVVTTTKFVQRLRWLVTGRWL